MLQKFLIILAIVLVALVGLILFHPDSPFQCLRLPQYESTGNNTFGLIAKRDPCLGKAAAKFNAPRLCGYAFDKQYCLSEFAQSGQSTDSCKQLQGTENQDYCIRNIAVIEKKDPQFCLQISDDIAADNCLMDLSGTAIEVDYCENFRQKNTAFYATCLSNVARNTQDSSLCNPIQLFSIFNARELFLNCIQNATGE
ncbi:hypothetical protein C4579_00120 [Candidatus Microgenomates bacterium]|nr:MAG: hypothetical protein C4579_00120 [Candidatus Microgenomates bacterium]